MEYKIINNDLWVNQEGNHELFLNIQITNDGDVWNTAARLPASDVARVVADATAINDIALEMVNAAILRRPQEKIDAENRRILELEQIKLDAARELVRAKELELEIARLKV